MRSLVAPLFVFALFAFACGTSEPSIAGADSGMVETPPDGGRPNRDAEPAPDARPDTGTPDAEPALDAAPDGGITDGGDPNPMLSAGCGKEHATGETTETIDVDGRSRTFILTIPGSYDPNTPTTLVFGWHAFGGTGMSIRAMGVYEQSGGTIIAVHPNGTNVGGGSGWVLDPIGIDAAFYDAMYTMITDSLCIDLSHVYSYGFSFGGFMTNMLGCIRGDELLAIAPFHAGGPSSDWSCTGEVSVLMVNAADDQTVPIEEGIASRDYWVMENGCDPTMTMPVEPSPCVEYLACQDGQRVIWCMDPNGGHAPPPDLPSRTWSFFSQF